MRTKLCLYIMLALLSPLAHAEYYLVYPAPPCCEEDGYYCHHYRHVSRHHHMAYHHYHHRSSYRIEVYYPYYPPCYGGCGPCGGCETVYTSEAGHCVTYDEVVNGTYYYIDN